MRGPLGDRNALPSGKIFLRLPEAYLDSLLAPCSCNLPALRSNWAVQTNPPDSLRILCDLLQDRSKDLVGVIQIIQGLGGSAERARVAERLRPETRYRVYPFAISWLPGDT